jgi:hypothetical protein
MRGVAILLSASLLAAAGCDASDSGGAAEPEPTTSATSEQAPQPPVAGPPDAGTRFGHGADATRVRVPDRDESPPTAEIALERADGTAVARAAQPGEAPADVVRLPAARLRGTTTGVDGESGVARVRVSVKETITCEDPDGDRVERERIRYFPPPQIERIRSSPGARLSTRAGRTVTVSLGRGRCPARSEPVAIAGELWGEAINGLGLEAVTPHIRFEYRG